TPSSSLEGAGPAPCTFSILPPAEISMTQAVKRCFRFAPAALAVVTCNGVNAVRFIPQLQVTTARAASPPHAVLLIHCVLTAISTSDSTPPSRPPSETTRPTINTTISAAGVPAPPASRDSNRNPATAGRSPPSPPRPSPADPNATDPPPRDLRSRQSVGHSQPACHAREARKSLARGV